MRTECTRQATERIRARPWLPPSKATRAPAARVACQGRRVLVWALSGTMVFVPRKRTTPAVIPQEEPWLTSLETKAYREVWEKNCSNLHLGPKREARERLERREDRRKRIDKGYTEKQIKDAGEYLWDRCKQREFFKGQNL